MGACLASSTDTVTIGALMKSFRRVWSCWASTPGV